MADIKLTLARFIALGFGSGKMPVAPGTFGTVVGVLLFWVLGGLPVYLYILLCFIFLLIGIWASQVYSDFLGVHDHGSIVWDEVVGYMIGMIAMPVEWSWMLVGFLLFRLFDIWKPYPIRLLDEKVEGGLGIMLDDVLAGIYTLIVVQGLYYAFI